MKKITQYWKLMKRGFGTALSAEMIYKTNFIIKMLVLFSMDLIGPLVTLLIYSNTLGIPGWSFYEFLLFQGTLILVTGFGHLMILLPVAVMDQVKEGNFDKTLTKPFSPLLYITLTKIDLDGIAEMLAGLLVIAFSLTHLEIILFPKIIAYIYLLLLAFVFQYSLSILIANLGILFIKSWALFDLIFSLTNFARYPLTIYGFGLTFFLTFIFPIAVSAFYPAEALLRGLSTGMMFKLTLVVFGFLMLNILLWKTALRKYTSAGG